MDQTRRIAETLSSKLLAHLEEMDRECATGLCDYGTHEAMPTKIEKAFHLGLARRLEHDGYRVEVEKRYPESRRTCDLYVTSAEGVRCWIEVKLAWRQWFFERLKRNSDGLYRPYLFGPLVPGWEKSHSVAQDTEKLEAIGSASGELVGVLGIGFDSASREIQADLDELSRLGQLTRRQWNLDAIRSWCDPRSADCRLTCWFWWRATASGPAPTRTLGPIAGIASTDAASARTNHDKSAQDEGDKAALQWAEDHLDELRGRAASVFRRFMAHERQLKSTGGAWMTSWTWEAAVAEILRVRPESCLALRTGESLRAREHTYQVENYGDDWRFDRLLDNFEKSLFD